MQGACQPLQALRGVGLRRISWRVVCDKGGELSGLRQPFASAPTTVETQNLASLHTRIYTIYIRTTPPSVLTHSRKHAGTPIAVQ